MLGDHQVAGLDVAVHHALGVRLRQPAVLELLFERPAFVVRHDDEELAIVGGLDAVNGADVRMVGGRRGLRLADEALLGGLVVTPLRRQELERNVSAEFRVARLVNHAHPAAAELGGDLVVDHGPANEGIHRLVWHARAEKLLISQTFSCSVLP